MELTLVSPSIEPILTESGKDFRSSEYTRMSSRYMTMETSIISAKMLFMNLWKLARALVSPLGITSHSKDPYRVQKVVFHLSPLAMWTRW